MAGKISSLLRPNLGFVLIALGAGVGAAALFFTSFGPSHAAPGAAGEAFRVAVVSQDAGVTPPARPLDKDAATKRVQRCYAKLGYYKGPIDGKANKATRTAHGRFKDEHGLKAYEDFLSEPVQRKLAVLCKEELKQVAALKEPDAAVPVPAPASEPDRDEIRETVVAGLDAAKDAAPATEAAPAPESVPESAPLGTPSTEPEPAAQSDAAPQTASLEIDCLPEDLRALLQKAHGMGVTARTCRPGCLPAPDGLSQKQLDDLYGRYGVVWCRSCVQIDGHLSLKDVRRIEQAGTLDLCSTPPRQMPRPGSANGNVVKSFSRIRELYRAAPTVPEDENAIAVIVGNSAYDKLPPARTARNDAGAMYFFLTESLGLRQDQVIDLRNATRADLERVFGPVPGSDGELKRLVQARPKAKVIVYYSGHGATNAEQNETYLVPVDAEPYREERGGYPLSTLYANLASLKAEQVLVLLESSFGRDHGAYILPPNIPETTLSALPPQPQAPVTVLVSADRGQRALMDPGYDVGLFTRYLIEGLAGRADLAPVGNGDGRIDSAELYAYVAAMVRLAARKTFGLLQNPAYSSAGAAILKAPGDAEDGAKQG